MSGGPRRNLAGWYPLIVTCELHDVDPLEYLRDVLLRAQVVEQGAVEIGLGVTVGQGQELESRRIGSACHGAVGSRRS